MKLAKYKDKERILKAARDKRAVTYKERLIRLMDLSTETWQGRKEWQEIFNVMNRKKIYAAENLLSSKSVIQNKRREKSFPKQTKTEGIHHHQTSPTRDPKGDPVRQGTRDITTSMTPTYRRHNDSKPIFQK